jgi:hypothetical protein
MLSVAGTNRQILAQAPGDTPKQVSMAGVILTTAALAALSCIFALQMALHLALPAAVVVGVLWGVGIANLDRWLITATARQPTTWGNIKLALPRIFLAVIIGAVISTPITLQVFGSEIASEMTVMQAEKQAAFTSKLAQDPRYRALPSDRDEIVRLQKVAASGFNDGDVFKHPAVADLRSQLATVNKQLAKAEAAVVCEKEGTCGSGRVGAGPAFREKVELRDRLRAERKRLNGALNAKTAEVRSQVQQTATQTQDDAKARIEQLQETVRISQTALDAELQNNAAAVRNGDGLLARLTALERISNGSRTLATAHLALFLFFTAMECLPVLFKLLLSLGKPSLYENLSTTQDDAAYASVLAGLRTDHEKQDIDMRTTIEGHERRTWNQMEAEVEAAQRILDAQKALVAKAVDAWKVRQEQLLDTDLDRFINVPPEAGNRHPSNPPNDGTEASSAHRTDPQKQTPEPVVAVAVGG